MDDRLHDAAHVVGGKTGRAEQLCSTLLCAGDDDARLSPRPLERLVDLGPGGVRQLGRLVARLLEQARGAGLGLAQLLAR